MKVQLSLGAVLAALALVLAGCGGADTQELTPIVSGDLPTATGDADAGDVSVDPGVMQAIGPGLSVGEALASDLTEPLLVRGFIYIPVEGDVYLTEGLAESLPPLPMEPKLVVEGLDLNLVDGLQTSQGISWTDQVVQVLGEMQEGVLVVSTNASA